MLLLRLQRAELRRVVALKVDVMMAEVDTVAGRDRRSAATPETLQATETRGSDGLRWRKRATETAPAETASDDGALCMKRACVVARAERDQACAGRDKKVAELQLLRGQLFDLAAQVSDSDTELGVCSRAIQVALMEILDGVDEDEESAEEPAEAAGSNKTASGGDAEWLAWLGT